MKSISFLLACTLFTLATIQAQEQSPVDFERAGQQLDSLLEASKESKLIRSGYVYITHKGKPVYSNGNGWANRENKEPFTEDTKQCIGSIGKSFTAAAILLLHQRGVLSIHDPISKHLPELEGVDGITIEQLVRHTSGITAGHWNFRKISKIPDTDTVRYTHYVEYFNGLKEKDRRHFKPMERVVYSNFCFGLLGHIVERNTERGFRKFVEEELFKPLGMEGAVAVDRIYLDYKPGFSNPYLLDKKYKKELPYSFVKGRKNDILPSNMKGSSGIYASAKDLAKIEKMWDTNLIFDSTSLSEISKIQRLQNGKNGLYTYGFIPGFQRHFSHYFQMTGRVPGYLSMVCYYYNVDITLVIFINEESITDSQYPNFKRSQTDFRGAVMDILEANKLIDIGKTGESYVHFGDMHKKEADSEQ